MQTLRDLAEQRLLNGCLIGVPSARPEDALAWLGAVQAQDYAGAKWALGQRTHRGSDEQLESALQSGRILRTHVLRPTWHFVLPADIRWMLELTAPRVNAASAYHERKVELDAATFARSNTALAKALEGGNYLTRDELGRVLEGCGIAATGVRLGHLMMRAELDGVLTSGPRRAKQFTYALLDERVSAYPSLSRDAALAELTRRYYRSHGPATLADFAWWSGLTLSDVRAGVAMLGRELSEETVDGEHYWFAPRRDAPTSESLRVHLLPNFDEYLVAYKDHRVAIDAGLEKKLGRRSNVLGGHIIVVEGRVVGGWRRHVRKDHVSIETKLIGSLDRATKQALAAAGERYGEFLGLPAEVVRG
jgi:hypothetical protein